MQPTSAELPVALAQWHRLVQTRDVRGLSALIAPDAVFHSPVVHTPQVGHALTVMYLQAAFHVLMNDSFKYVREIVGSHDACLEFEVTLMDESRNSVLVNGIDLIRWNDHGQITDFKVMLRPLKAVNLIHQLMGQMLAKT